MCLNEVFAPHQVPYQATLERNVASSTEFRYSGTPFDIVSPPVGTLGQLADCRSTRPSDGAPGTQGGWKRRNTGSLPKLAPSCVPAHVVSHAPCGGTHAHSYLRVPFNMQRGALFAHRGEPTKLFDVLT